MKARITYANNGARRFEIEGQEVTEEEFYAATPARGVEMLSEGKPPRGHTAGAWPMLSDALAVHPNQIDAARARNRHHGVLVDYAPDGRAILPDRGARRDLMKLEGCHDNEGGYGDETGGSSASKLPSREEVLGGPAKFIDEPGAGYVGETATPSVPDPVSP